MEHANTNWNLVTSIERWLRRNQKHTATQAIPELDSAISTTTGCVRKENQDCAIAARFADVPGGSPIALFVVCDGLGGMKDGATIAQRTVAVLVDSFIRSSLENTKDRLRTAIMAANRVIFSQYHQRGGTTIALVCCTAKSRFAFTAGDTRVYSLGPKSPLMQVSIDDTIAGELSRMPNLNVEALQLERFENQLSQFIGVGSELAPHVYDLPPRKGVSYFIASDGAYNIGSTFESILVNASDPRVAAERITQISQWMGGKDNASIICMSPDESISLGASEQPMLELWSATSALNILTTRHFSNPEVTPEAPSHLNEMPGGPNDSRGKTTKRRRTSRKAKAPTQPRPPLQIEFEKPPEQNRDESSFGSVNSPDGQNEGTDPSLLTERQPTVAENEEKLDG